MVKNLTDKVILRLTFITLIYPFKTEYDGIITYLFDEPVKFNFLSNPEILTLKAFQENNISKALACIQAKTKQITFLQEEINFKRIENQLQNSFLQQKIKTFEQKIMKEICSDIPTAFWHRKKHIISLPYIKEFNEKNIPTKARPIQMSHEIMDFCKNEINDLLNKDIIRPSKSP